ncbi:hypothetical protein XAC3218_1120011 [Xanthomonas citri pv. citri]|nr:hypothetical protein XAC3218_1120011 [Xanthomonas citri pv. citri]CEH83510.1 hypothetical protein XACB302_10730012 [Xanthomonas citri pv. citri]
MQSVALSQYQMRKGLFTIRLLTRCI